MYYLPLYYSYFRTCKKSNSLAYVYYIEWWSLNRSRNGFSVPYQFMDLDRVNVVFLFSRYVPMAPFWADLQLYSGMFSELTFEVIWLRFNEYPF